MALMSRYIKRRNKGRALICKDQTYRRGAYSSSALNRSFTAWISIIHVYGKVDQDNEITNPNSPVSYLLEVFLTPMNVFYKMM